MTIITGTLHKDQYMLQLSLLRIRNVSKILPNKFKHNLCSMPFFFENCAVYEITWKNIVQPDKLQMIMRRMRIACYITKATKHTQNM